MRSSEHTKRSDRAGAATPLPAADPPAVARCRTRRAFGGHRANTTPRHRTAPRTRLPVESTRGLDGGYQLGPGGRLPPLLLSDDEAVAVAVGLRAAAGAAIGGIEDTSVQALAKIEQMLPDRLRRRVSALHASVVSLRRAHGDDEVVDPDALSVLASACRDHEEVRFDSHSRHRPSLPPQPIQSSPTSTPPDRRPPSSSRQFDIPPRSTTLWEHHRQVEPARLDNHTAQGDLR